MNKEIRELLDKLWVQFDEIVGIVKESDDILSNTAAIQLLHFKCEKMEQAMAHLYVASAHEGEFDQARVESDMDKIDALRLMYMEMVEK